MPEQPASPAAPSPAGRRFSLLDRWFRPVHVPRDAPAELADLAARGSVVFVMRSAGLLNFLFLAWLLRQHALPPLRAALGLKGLLPWLARVRSSPAALRHAIANGHASVVFLSRTGGPDPFQLLVGQQRRARRPIFLVPALLVWTRRPQRLKPTLGEILFGTPDAPSRFANGIGFVLNHRRGVLRLGRASDLGAFLADRARDADPVLARLVRGALHLHLAGQVRAVVGPPLKSAARMREQVLRDKGLRASLAAVARDTGRPLAEVEREAERDLREIASRYSPAFIEFMRSILSRLFRRLYDAVDVDEEGLARVKRAAADAPIVLCPSHKSHVDYLVLSWVFHENGMTPPHIAAGINLAFWPFGAIARRGGAFFIRRSLRGDRVYTATLRGYVKQLLRDRFPQEFYLEGGRSRSGKLLFPKTGLFSMEVDAWLEGATDDVLFVPVAIDYELLMEGGSYARELAGGEKKKEDFRGLLRARKVLGRRYGRLTIQFEEPVSLREFAQRRLGARAAESLVLDDAQGIDPAAPAGLASESGGADGGGASKRLLVQALANRVAYGINRAITMTPVGLVCASVLAHVRRGVTAPELTRRIELLRRVARDQGARFAKGLEAAPSDPTAPGPIAEAIARLASEGSLKVEQAAGETIYQPVEERRPLLDYHRNAVIHRYVPMSLLCCALRACGMGAAVDEVKARTRWLSRLFKLEFMFRVGATFDDIFAENAAALRALQAVTEEPLTNAARTSDGAAGSAGAVTEEAQRRLLAGPDRTTVEFLAELLRPYLESYLVAAESLRALDAESAPLDRRALVKASLEQGRAAYAAGRIALRESVSKATFENAAEWLFQQGAVAPGEDGRPRLAASWRDAKLPELIREIEAAVRA